MKALPKFILELAGHVSIVSKRTAEILRIVSIRGSMEDQTSNDRGVSTRKDASMFLLAQEARRLTNLQTYKLVKFLSLVVKQNISRW